jgi:beta-lactamase regulating signal transducer with metallopeptidase domain
MILEAALRSLLLALAVGAGLQILRVRNVIAQKAAWGLVLGTAFLMPALMHWRPYLPSLALTLPPGSIASIVDRVSAVDSVPTTAQASPAAFTAGAPKTPARIASQDFATENAPYAAPRRSSKKSHRSDFDKPIAARATAMTLPEMYTGVPPSTSPTPAAQPHRSISWVKVASLLYLAVAAGLLLRLFYGLASAIRLWRSAEPVLLSEDTPRLSLRSSRAVSSPVTIGSSILLPADYATWDPEKLRIVVAHERSHIRQGDFYMQFLAELYAALVWFSPLGWWLKRVLSDLAETISDRAGLEQAASNTSYAQILLEFAAAPRTASLGVAMARPGSLSRRVERLLNDHAFRQAFAGGRRRALIALLLVPVALFAATALVHVQAAQDSAVTPSAQPAPAEQPVPRAKPSPAHRTDQNLEATEDQPSDNAWPRVVVIPPIPKISIVVPRIPPVPPIPAITIPKIVVPTVTIPKIVIPPIPAVAINGPAIALLQEDGSRNSRHGYRYRYANDGDSYAIIRGGRAESMTFSGDMHTVDIDKARKLAHGDFLWFEHDDRQYYIDDPATLAQIEAMYKPIEELGQKQEELGRQQEELGKQQEALGRQQEEATVPAPDMQKEMAEIDAAMAKIKAKMGQNVTQDELGDLQNKLGDLQGKLGDLQGTIGAKQGELGEQQGKLGDQQGRLGAEQGRLGAEQGRLSMEADRKVHSIIDDSLTSGKAHPVN